MPEMQSATEAYETRSVAEALSETGIFFVSFAVAVALPFTIISGVAKDPIEGIRAFSAGGELLFQHLPWAMSLYVTVLLAFYAVVIGGQVLSKEEFTAHTRRGLALAAEMLAAAAFILMAFVAVYCASSPQNWPIMVVLIPAACVVLFLAAQLGKFLIPDRAVRLSDALRTRSYARERLKSLRQRSRVGFVRVWFANSAVVTVMVSTGTYLVLGGFVDSDRLWPVGAVALLYAAVAALLLGWNAYALHVGSHSAGRFTPTFLWVMTIVIYAALTTLFWPLVKTLPELGWPLAAAWLATALTSLWPPGVGKQFMTDWSIRGAARRVTARSFAKSYAGAVRTCIELQPGAPAVPLLQRLIAVVRG